MKIAEINWELNPSYPSLIFVFSIYSWGCVSWSKLCSLFFFCKSWTKFICGWVINNLDGLLTENMSWCMFAVAFCFDRIYFYSLFRLITHLMILAKEEPQKGLSEWNISKQYLILNWVSWIEFYLSPKRVILDLRLMMN